MDNISSWVRQARHRAKRYNILNDLPVSGARSVLDAYGSRCAYCGTAAVTLDHPIPLAGGAPNVPANVLPCCKQCKGVKRGQSIVQMFEQGHITEQVYVRLVSEMISRPGGDSVREILRREAGII